MLDTQDILDIIYTQYKIQAILDIPIQDMQGIQ